MNKIEEVGYNAGKIWSYLNNKNEPVDVLELKFQIKLSNTDLYLALGWLSREDKIVYFVENNKLKIKLK